MSALAPTKSSFRGSITRLPHSLCMLRSRGYPRTTQHSVLGWLLAFAGQDSSCWDPLKVSVSYMTSSFSRLRLAHHLDEPRGDAASPPTPQPHPAAPVRQADEAEPLTAELRRFHITVSKRFLAKLSAARDALSHSHPGADTEAVLDAALDLLLAKHDRRKGLVKKPRAAPPRPSERPRHIPAEVKRAVWTRDGGRCQWPVASGGVCGSTRQLELDHVVPVARGGASTAANLRVTCRLHNQYAARQAFGDAWMDQFTSRPLPGPDRGPAPIA